MYVDIHNHILPAVDDGPKTVAESLEMARLAVADGAHIMAATPHRRMPWRNDISVERLRDEVAALQQELDSAEIPLRIVPGLEIPIRPEVAAELLRGTLMTLGDNGRTVLIEPPFERLPDDALENIRRIREAGFEVVLAHPERNARIQQDLRFLAEAASLGITFQLTSGSLTGIFGRIAERTALAILARAHEWPLVIASDAHEASVRVPGQLTAARDIATTIAGPEEAHRMVATRPETLITP